MPEEEKVETGVQEEVQTPSTETPAVEEEKKEEAPAEAPAEEGAQQHSETPAEEPQA